jgi:hypothetical protein
MKRVAFIVVLIAVIVGMVFGGLSMASPASAVKPTPTPTCHLFMFVNGNGTTDPPEGLHDYPCTSTVSITAIPAPGWLFVNWTGSSVEDPNSASTTVTLNAANTTATANFSPIPPPTSGPVYMDTIYGYDHPNYGYTLIAQQDYPGIRHVSLTLALENLNDVNDYCLVTAAAGNGVVFSQDWQTPCGPMCSQYVNVQFDADYWTIAASDNPVSAIPFTITYAATATYPGR